MCEYTVKRMKRQPRIEKVFTNHIMDLYPKYMFYLMCVCVYLHRTHIYRGYIKKSASSLHNLHDNLQTPEQAGTQPSLI